MSLLFTPKRHLTILGIFPVAEKHFPAIFREFRLAFNFVHILFVVLTLIWYSFSVLIFPFLKANTFDEYSESFLFCSVTVLRTVLYIILILEKVLLSALMDELTEIVEKRSAKIEIRIIYGEQIEKSEKIVKTFWTWAVILGALAVIPKALASIHGYFATYSIDAFQLIMPIVLPWTWTNIWDYIIITSLVAAWFYSGLFVTVAAMEIFAGFSTLISAFILDIKQSLKDFNNSIVCAREKFSAKERIDICENLCEILEFHATAKQFTDRFSTTYSSIITSFVCSSNISICASLLSLNSAVETHRFADIIRMGVGVNYVLLYISLFCFFGDQVSNGFEEINDTIYQCSWEAFPIELQRLLPIMMMNAQKPIYIHGKMNIQCTREMFKMIVNRAYSYFSMLRGASH